MGGASAEQAMQIFHEGSPRWWKVLCSTWFVLSLAVGVYVVIETRSSLALALALVLCMLPLVVVARLARQGKWRSLREQRDGGKGAPASRGGRPPAA